MYVCSRYYVIFILCTKQHVADIFSFSCDYMLPSNIYVETRLLYNVHTHSRYNVCCCCCVFVCFCILLLYFPFKVLTCIHKLEQHKNVWLCVCVYSCYTNTSLHTHIYIHILRKTHYCEHERTVFMGKSTNITTPLLRVLQIH